MVRLGSGKKDRKARKGRAISGDSRCGQREMHEDDDDRDAVRGELRIDGDDQDEEQDLHYFELGFLRSNEKERCRHDPAPAANP